MIVNQPVIFEQRKLNEWDVFIKVMYSSVDPYGIQFTKKEAVCAQTQGQRFLSFQLLKFISALLKFISATTFASASPVKDFSKSELKHWAVKIDKYGQQLGWYWWQREGGDDDGNEK